MKRSYVAGFALLLAPAAFAQERPIAISANAPMMNERPAPDMVVGIGLSSLGANVEAAYRLDATYRVRGVVMGGVDVDYDEANEDGDFSGNLTLGGVALLGDFYPLQTGWRVSGGLLMSKAELTATGTANLQDATNVDTAVAVRFARDIAPMITTGYDISFDDGWSLNTEAGVIFTGGIDVTYTADDPSLQDQLDNDPDLQNVVDDASAIPIYPYASVTVSFRF